MNNSSENSSDKLDNIADTVTIGSEPEVTFSVNDVVNSFEELERKIKQYRVKKQVQLWRRDSRTIEAASKRIDRYLDELVKYYELTYSCIHGGRKFQAKGEGKRATQ